ncbi:unnamed protein product [Psylliodes chrysocephalus]|uniref:HAT C-terminal dimerisation domain-containing protein n=1 Tax=Psylliodes chrysocephalus TaxID=3402493 RepID=A0A9P0D3U1_9CUCU|nr:unnamed protein product [Psylliodes chrysocephala]
MSFKSKPSGAEFRKRREEKDEENEKVIKKVSNSSNAEELAFEPDLVPELQNKSADAEDGVHVERGRGSADFFSSDPALWDISDELRVYICAQSSVEQNCDSDFNESVDQHASNMSGIYSGVQARIKQLSPMAEYVPAHSLNLIGSCAAESCNFFSASPHRWTILTRNCALKLQNLSKTRWSARHNTCRAVNESREVILKSLDEITSDCDERHSTRNEARIINKKRSSLETTIMAAQWDSILERFNKVNVKLQYETTELGKIVAYYDSLCSFLQEKSECKYSDLHNRELLSAYPEDLEPVVVDECLHLKVFLLKNTENENIRMSMIEISKVLYNFDMADVYPNFAIALRMVLSASATNCSAERSFSTLRRVKNYLRSTTSHDRLISLALFAIEGRLTQSISYDDIIDKFARKKARRKAL